MASSSSTSSHSGSPSSSRSYEYDVFLSFRGEDTRKTFVDHLYSALVDRQINTYKDDVTLPRGESIGSHLFKAIKESSIAVIVFSENYADSSWCLDELAYIMKCRGERGLVVMPVFYGVDPSDVRKQKRKFGKAFAKQENENTDKADLWRKSLVNASKISGWEPKNIANGNEAQVIKQIVGTIFDKLFSLNSDVDEDLVGMRDRLQDLESRLGVGSGGVRMVGIWGCGGSGKTTLATSVCMEISQQFQGHCIVENVREKTIKDGLHKLQENILSALFRTYVKGHSVVEGKRTMKNMLCRRKVLLLLDDVDELGQLEALAGKHNWFGSGSRIIITTRDEHLLRTHKVDHVYSVTLLSDDEAIRLLRRHAYNEEEPVEDYETLSLRVISYASGLPLAIKVLGSFLYDKSKNEWISALDKLKDIPDLEVMDILKTSYDGLEPYQKELFLDIACLWRFHSLHSAMEILEACGYHPKIGIKVLRQKALITVVHNHVFGDVFDMHDLVQEMGHYVVRGKHPKDPEKHSRVWIHKEIKEMCFRDSKMENDKIETIKFFFDDDDDDLSSRFCKVISNMKKLRWLSVLNMYISDDKYHAGPTFLSNELLYMDWSGYPSRSPCPDNFQPTKLVVLKLHKSKQEELWKDCKCLPNLKVLELCEMEELLITPNFNGLPCLQKLRLNYCDKLEEIHPSFGNHTNLEYVSIDECPKLRMFPSIAHMEKLKALKISYCHLKDGEISAGIGELSNLQELNLSGNDFSRLDFSISQLTHLKFLNLRSCNKLIELPKLPSSLVILEADYCQSLRTIGDCHINCKWLCLVSLEGSKTVIGGGRLLQSMLEGNAIDNGSMLLIHPGLEMARGFRPRLLRGTRYTLQLPETSWSDDFSGFLMCVVSKPTVIHIGKGYALPITVKQVSSYMDSEDDAFWEEMKPMYLDPEDDASLAKYYCEMCVTWVWYVSFGSLKHTTWWDQTYKYLEFNIEEGIHSRISGFGVRLIAKKSGSGLAKTSTNSSTNYTPPAIHIRHDSKSALRISARAFINKLYSG